MNGVSNSRSSINCAQGLFNLRLDIGSRTLQVLERERPAQDVQVKTGMWTRTSVFISFCDQHRVLQILPLDAVYIRFQLGDEARLRSWMLLNGVEHDDGKASARGKLKTSSSPDLHTLYMMHLGANAGPAIYTLGVPILDSEVQISISRESGNSVDALFEGLGDQMQIGYTVVSLNFVFACLCLVTGAVSDAILAEGLGLGKVLHTKIEGRNNSQILGLHVPYDVDNNTSDHSHLRQIVATKDVHLLAAFTLLYVGAEVTIGGWSVTYIFGVRGGGPSSGYISPGFFGGMQQRLLIDFDSSFIPWIGERLALLIYAVLAIILELIVWFVPSLVGDAVAVSVIGVLLGPMYPIAMNHAGCILPRWLRAGALQKWGRQALHWSYLWWVLSRKILENPAVCCLATPSSSAFVVTSRAL
ncbi:hypothetical protein EV702DRAFT_1221882 [Suillus placidus]|uniref:Uncharacterized protein n=1 Tax=Suillus placidus TaxID=48579 RepID=A0A9P6ZH42_9AGAM|nr:hypothetical protein EV702DRAFT_1221882 [Suillus placidus]